MRPAKKMDLLRRRIVAVELVPAYNENLDRMEKHLQAIELDDGTRVVFSVSENDSDYTITAHVSREGSR